MIKLSTPIISFCQGVKRNLLLAAMMTVATMNANAQTIFTENFEGVATTAVLPNGGWTSFDVTAGNSIWGIGASSCIITGAKSMFVCRASIANLCDYAPASTTNKIAYKTFSATGYNTLLLNFKWKCVGENIGTTIYDYGKVCYSTNGTTWTDLAAVYQAQAATQTVSNLALPASLNGAALVYLGFRWINDNSTKNIPGFVVDDITVTATASGACSGTPTAGTTQSTSNPVCSGASFTLSLSGATTLSGLTYQWQSAPDVAGVPGAFTNVAGGTSAALITSQTAIRWYHAIVTCTNGGTFPATSTNLKVTMGDACNCGAYCAASQTTGTCGIGDEYIGNVTFNTINNTSTCAQSLPSGYTNYTGISTNVTQGLSYTLTVSNPNSFAGDQCHAFFDWNADGDWSDAGEDITLTGGPSSFTFTGTIPMTSAIGTTRMRVRVFYTGVTPACGAVDYGEAEDYCINILAAAPCGGTPAASSTVSSANPACYNTAFTLSLGTNYNSSGITYQWQSAPDVFGSPGTFANVPSGGNSFQYSATQTATTWYHAIVTCTNGGASITSANLQVTTQLCYCIPIYSNGCANDKITNFVLNTLSNNSGTTCSTSPAGYSVYGTSPANQTTSLIKGNSYVATITVTTGNANGTGVTIWIDYNDNGVFEVSERSDNGATKFVSNTTGTITVNVPGSAASGLHRMRVRSMRNTLSDAIDPCLAGNAAGEAEDYSVTVLPCGATAGATTPICQYLNQNLTSTYFGNGTPVSYSWIGPNGFTSSSQNPTIANVQPANAGTYTVTITDNASCVSEANVIFAVTAGPDPVASSNSPVCEGGTISFSADNNAPGQTTSNSYQWTGPSFSSSLQNPSIGSATAANNGNYTVVVTNQYLCTATSAPVIVNVTPGPVPSIASQTNVSCYGLEDGIVDIDAPTGTLYTDGSNFNTDGIFTLFAGTYTITAYDVDGCSADIGVVITQPDTLIIAASANGPLCAGSTINLSSSTTGGTTTYSWSWSGPSYTSSDEDPIITGATAAATGAYTVTVTDAHGCTDEETVNVIVHAAIPPSPGIVSGPSSVCVPANNVLLSVTPVAEADNYSWVLSPGTNAVTFTGATDQSTILANFGTTTNSTYAIRVYAVNACGTSTSYGPFFTRRAVSTPLNPTGDNLACANDVKPYTIPAVTGAETYTWSGPAGSLIDGNPTPYTANVTSVNVTFPAGFTSGQVCVAANVGCFTTVNKCISVNSSSAALGSITGATYTVCPGNNYTYSVPPAVGAASYTWILPPNITGSSSTNSINVTVNAGFTSGDIKVFATSICGSASAQKSRSLVAGIPSVPPSISGPSNGLCGQTAVYTCPSQAGVTYSWAVPPGAIINSGDGTNSINVTFGTFTTGTVCVTATNACGTSASRCNTVRGAPNTPANITPTPGSWCANTQGIVFNANVSNVTGAYTLSWTYPPATVATYVIGGGNSTSLTLDWITGTGNVIITAANACGSGSQKYVASNSCREDGLAFDENFINVSPNPAHDFIYVSFTMQSKEAANLIVTDLSGRMLLSNSVNTEIGLNKTQLDVRNLAKGLYIISLHTNGETVQKRVVIE